MSGPAPAKAAPVASPASTLTQGHALLQRCACGGSKSSLADECESCQSRALQRKVLIGAPDDPYELEADRVADQVLQRKSRSSTPLDPITVRRTSMQPPSAAAAPVSVERTLARAGMPLDRRLRADMETRFAHDFSQVRLHADSTAADSARDVSARAYTVGRDIVFGAGQFAPSSEDGRRLIAHELTHVVQQSAASPLARRRIAWGLSAAAGGEPAIQPKLKIGNEDDEYEREADRVASRVMRMSAPVMPAAPGRPASHGPTQNDALGPHDLTDGGTPLPDSLRGFYERRFGRDLSEVRLHSGPHSAARNEQLGAYAFTYGSHIWLGEGQDAAPGYLLAHELAHVIQQRQPRPLTGHGSGSMRSTAESRVQRIGDSVPFWVPLGRRGRMTGDELHEEILGLAQAANGDLDVEANAPNADAAGCGVGHHGRVDVYRSTPLHVIPGMYFEAAPGTTNRDRMRVKNSRVGRTARASVRFRPYATSEGKKIEGIGEGPTKVELGELKPAAKPMLVSGQKQLRNYVCGMREAARFTNEWAATAIRTGATKRWDLKDSDVSRLGPSAFTIAPSASRRLVVADVRETEGRGAKYSVRVRDAWARSTLEVTGRLHVEKAKGRPGIWMYYARPENLDQLLVNLRSREIGADITVANDVQNQVIEPLVQAPQPAQQAPPQLAPLRKRGAPGVLQRKPKYDEKPAKFTDPFKNKLSTWLASQRKLRNKIARPGGDLKKELAALELFEEAHDAQESLAQVPETGAARLPNKTDVIDVVTKADPKTGRKEKKHPRRLGEVLGWLKFWTSAPAEIIGVFRAAFGGVFVKVAHLASGIGNSALFTKIKGGVKTLFDGVKMASGAIATVMKEGLVWALDKIADLLLPSVFRMVAGAVKTGINNALNDLFGKDRVDEAIAQFQKWKDLLETIEQKVESALAGALSFLTEIVGVLQTAGQIAATVRKAQRAIKIGIRLAQCAGVWSCLLAVASLVADVDDKIIMKLKDKILSLCNVRSLLGGMVRTLMKDVPVRIANGILSLVHGVIPNSLTPLKTVFAGRVQPEPVPELSEMEDRDCWGIDLGFSLFDDGFSHPKRDGDKKDDEKGDPRDRPNPGKGGRGSQDPKGTPDTKSSKGTKDVKQGVPPATKPPDQPAADQPAPQRLWDSSALMIAFALTPEHLPADTAVPMQVFRESRDIHTRQKDSSAKEWSRFCIQGLYQGSVSFYVDDPWRGRPTPFTPPIVTVAWRVGNRHHEVMDAKPKYRPRFALGDGRFGAQPLETSFPNELEIPVSDKDVIELKFTLFDPDTGKALLYEDRVVVKITPCA